MDRLYLVSSKDDPDSMYSLQVMCVEKQTDKHAKLQYSYPCPSRAKDTKDFC